MKKQINPTIKAHLIRGAFYLLLLLAVCISRALLTPASRDADERFSTNAYIQRARSLSASNRG